MGCAGRYLTMLAGALLCGGALAAAPAPAVDLPTLDDALLATRNNDFALASRQLRELAAAGSGPAQHALALMALRGEGVAQDSVEALGYLLAARSYREDIPQSLIDELQAKLDAAGLDRAHAIEAKFSRAALAKSVAAQLQRCPKSMLRVEEERYAVNDPRPPVLVKKPNPDDYYPASALQRQAQGVVELSFVVDADGSLWDARIDRLVPSDGVGDLARAALNWSAAMQVLPAQRRGLAYAVRTTYRVNFRGGNSGFWQSGAFAKLKAEADQGKPEAQYASAVVLGESPPMREQYHVKDADLAELELQAAFADVAEAQLDASIRIRRSACGGLHPLAWSLLRRAAKLGNERARLWVAKRLAGGEHEAASGDEISTLIKGLANAQDCYVRKHAAFTMATTQLAGVRDPKLALQVADKALADCGNSQATEYEYQLVKAAALAADGRFDEAARLQQSVVNSALRLRRGELVMQAILASLQHHEMPDYAALPLAREADLLN